MATDNLCGFPSSVSDATCTLPNGHEAYSADRFHYFGVGPREVVDKELLLKRLQQLRQNPTEDGVLDLMDEVEGWSAPHRRIAITELDVAELRGRMLDLVDARTFLRGYVRIESVITAIDAWEADHEQQGR